MPFQDNFEEIEMSTPKSPCKECPVQNRKDCSDETCEKLRQYRKIQKFDCTDYQKGVHPLSGEIYCGSVNMGWKKGLPGSL